jgi:hypothetical protein
MVRLPGMVYDLLIFFAVSIITLVWFWSFPYRLSIFGSTVSRLPKLSANMDVTREFMLTPSCFALITKRE